MPSGMPGQGGRGPVLAPPLMPPLSAHASGRYFVNAAGVPVPMWADTGWELFNELTLSQARQYLDDRAARGFTGIICQATNSVRYVASSVAPASTGAGGAMPFMNSSAGTWDGDLTFANNVVLNVAQGSATGNFDADFSRPVNAYWDWVDTLINEMAVRGLYALIDPKYMGFGGGENDGWWRTLLAAQNTQSVCLGFGTYLGNRWKKHPNLILSRGTDMFPTSGSEGSARFDKIFQGLVGAGCTHLQFAHYQRSSDSLDYADYFASIKANGVYPGAGGGTHAPPIARARRAYARAPALPAFIVEWEYEGEGSHTREQVRSGGWWGYLETIAGYTFGNSPLWLFDTGWQSALASNGSQDMQRMIAFFNALPWYNLVPSGQGSMGTLITAGQGATQTIGTVGGGDTNNGNDWVSAACTPDGSTLVGYVPHAHTGTVTVDMTNLRGTSVCKWVDPTGGAPVSIGSIANTGPQVFTPPGTNSDGAKDWVLLVAA